MIKIGNEKQLLEEIISKSNNIATISVVASIWMAYPLKVSQNLLLTILSTKEFIIYDRQRHVSDMTTKFTPFDTKMENPYLQEERIESNMFTHRKNDLESTAFLLSFYEGYADFIYSIIDTHLENLSKTKNYENCLFGLALNRMDRRCYDSKLINENAENFLIELKPIIKVELKDFVIPENYLDPYTQLLKGWNWGHEILEKNKFEQNNINEWRVHKEEYEYHLKENLINTMSNEYSSGIALIGIKYNKDLLSKNELNWCESILLKSSNYFINSNFSEVKLIENNKYGYWNEYPAIISLAYLLNVENREVNIVEKNILRYVLNLTFENRLNQPRLEKLFKNLWINNREFALKCFYLLISQAQDKFEHRINVEVLLKEIEVRQIEKIDFNIVENNYDLINSTLLDKAFLLVSNCDYLDDELNTFLTTHIDYLCNYTDKLGEGYDSDANHHISLNFKENFPKLLINQKQAFTGILFVKFASVFFLNDSYLTNKSQVLKNGFGVLENCIRLINNLPEKNNNELIYNNFFSIWNLLLCFSLKARYNGLFDMLLFGIDWKDSATNWPPLAHNKTKVLEFVEIMSKIDIDRLIKFVSTIGTENYLFKSITLISNEVNKNNELILSTNYFSEKMIQRMFSIYNKQIKADPQKKLEFLQILDKMIKNKSAVAYLIRDSFVV